MSPIVLSPDIVADSWFTEKPQRLLWWAQLVMSAAAKNGTIVSVRGRTYKANVGMVVTTRGELAKMWRTTRDIARRFVENLEQKGLVRLKSDPILTQITICNYESYAVCRPNLDSILTQTEETDPVLTQINDCKSATKGNSRLKTDPKSNSPKEEKDEKRKNQRKKKNKEESSVLTDGRISKADTLSPPAREEAEEPKKEVKPNIITRCRAIFESYFKEIYNDSYYWSAKDAVATKGILQKIKFRRTDRPVPLPVDDDSMVEAFGKFIRSINKSWIINNFSLPKINSQYNDIISEIRSQRSSQYGFQTTAAGDMLSRQMQTVINDIAKADEYYRQNQ